VTEILKKTDASRTTDDCLLLSQSEDIVQSIAKRERLKELARQRHQEVCRLTVNKQINNLAKPRCARSVQDSFMLCIVYVYSWELKVEIEIVLHIMVAGCITF